MPIIGTRFSVSWSPTDADRKSALDNHSQTLERLKERGGLDWTELDAVLCGERYHARVRDTQDSAKRVHLILTQRAEKETRP